LRIGIPKTGRTGRSGVEESGIPFETVTICTLRRKERAISTRATISFCVTLIFVVVGLVPGQQFLKTVIKGDINGDGTVNTIDAILAVNIILYQDPPATEEEMCITDCNGDGNVNVLDIILIVNVILYPNEFRLVSSCAELNCDDKNTCTHDYCDSLCVQCKHIEFTSGTTCDDGNPCTENDQCVNGDCQGIPKKCDDNNPCTDDTCSQDSGCIYTETCCDNGLDDDGDGHSDCADGDCVVDCDGDGYCAAPCGNDRDDADPDIYPDAPEICNDGKDNDQDEDTDCDDWDCSITDVDGNTYRTVQIGDQCWMAENLKVTHYRNGDSIPCITDAAEWSNLSTGAYCNYGNDEENVSTYGRLYNWFTVKDSRNIAPDGWHVPSDEEWRQLEIYLGMSPSEAQDMMGWRGTYEGGKMKTAGTIEGEDGLWHSPNTDATNESAFAAVPGGHRNTRGYFDRMGTYAIFWSTTKFDSDYAFTRYLYYKSSMVGRSDGNNHYGFSIRCVRN